MKKNSLNKLNNVEREAYRKALLDDLSFDDENISSIFNQQKSLKYLSDWDDNRIVIDVTGDHLKHECIIDLNEITINCDGRYSVFNGAIPLTTFPNLVAVSKAYINYCAQKYNDNDDLKQAVNARFNKVVKFFIWMIKSKGVYRLSQLTREDYQDFIKQFSEKRNWTKLIDANDLLSEMLSDFTNKRLDLADFCNIERLNSKRDFNINVAAISKHIGVPIHQSYLPFWFRRKFQSLVGSTYRDHPDAMTTEENNDFPSVSTLVNLFGPLNLLIELPDYVDRPSLKPFPACYTLSRTLVRQATNKPDNSDLTNDGRTQNLPLEQAEKLFTEAVNWVYDYQDGVIEIINEYRNWISRYHKQYESGQLSCKQIGSKVKVTYPDYIPFIISTKAICRKHNLPFDSICLSNQNKNHDVNNCPSISDITNLLMSSCFTLITINHGRRLNEIQGYRKPYGLYFGCISENNGTNVIDIYIEKTLQEYSEFYVNKLVVDSVAALEELAQVQRPLGEERLTKKKTLAGARKDYLFRVRKFGVSSWLGNLYSSFSFRKHGESFFKRCGVDTDLIIGRSHIFRRIFSLLYYHRYDNAELLALQHHLRHLDPGMTLVYISDPEMRAQKNRIDALYGSRLEEEKSLTIASMEDVRSEMFDKTILEILNGKRSGGEWPKVVIGMYKKFMRDVKFNKLDLLDKSKLISNQLSNDNYARTPYPHGGCNAGHNIKTQSKANCYEYSDSVKHTEFADQNMCHGCIHHDLGDTNYSFLQDREKELIALTKNNTLPLHVIAQAKNELSSLKNVIKSEYSLKNENKTLIDNIVSGFQEHLDSRQE